MIENYLLVAIRNFLHQRFYSWINVIGLTTSLASALLILLWVNDELSVDQFHRDLDKIMKVRVNYSTDAGMVHWSNTPGPLAEFARDHVAGVQFAAPTFFARPQLLQYEDKSLMQSGCYADADFFSVFSFKLTEGTLPAKREDKSSILVSQSLARKLFGEQTALGKQIKVAGDNTMMITGIFEDSPSMSSLKFDFVMPFHIFKENNGDGFNWGNFDVALYLKLDSKDQIQSVSAAINKKWEEIVKAENEKDEIDYYLQPFGDVYLYGSFENGLPVGGKIDYVKIFVIVAIFILAMACVNFMNMATARALKRSKEIGIRKIAGAQHISLVFQFIGEAILTSALAATLAITLVYLILPAFNLLIGKQIHLALFSPFFLLSSFCLVVLTGILAGSYPAFVLSSVEPIAALKGKASQNVRGTGLRQALVIFQFSLTVVLIVCAIVSNRQLEFILNKNLGYDRHSVLSFEMSGGIKQKFQSFYEEASKQKGVINIARANETLVSVSNHTSSVDWRGKIESSKLLFRVIVTDHNFPQTMRLQLLDGRMFTNEISDVNNFIISKKAAEAMGINNPIGADISVWQQKGRIVGIMDDFHVGSLKNEIEPTILFNRPDFTNKAYIRFEDGQTEQVVTSLQRLFEQYNPEYPFDYKFMTDDFEKQYKTEQVTKILAAGFTSVAVIISGLGLLGLTAYTTQRRQKEIGIRKTLGASVPGLVQKISSEFIKLTLIAVLIGCPVAYSLMSIFLDGYAYHMTMSWDIFLITSILALALTLAIVIYQVLKAASANPVEVLRSE